MHEPSASDPSADVAAVAAANAAFYAAFEAADVAAMAEIWEQSARSTCTHPGTPTVVGWEAVERSWQLILGSGGVPQFIVTEDHIEIEGDVGWVTAVENMIMGGSSAAGSVVNWFVRSEDGRWLLVGHHGASITRPPIA